MERDHFGRCKNCKYFYFNSHAHVERDSCFKGIDNTLKISTHTLTWSVTTFFPSKTCVQEISTHTLTWSVTICKAVCLVCLADFNSHAHVERDHPDRFRYTAYVDISTHTLTWSVTGRYGLLVMDLWNFNSHAHVERDFRKCRKA